MHRFLCTLAALAVFAALALAESPVAGTWSCVSKSTAENSPELETTLTIVERDGVLSGKLKGPDFEMPIYEPKVDGAKFTFIVKLNDQPYVIDTKLSGSTFEGKFSGPDASGVSKGKKQG